MRYYEPSITIHEETGKVTFDYKRFKSGRYYHEDFDNMSSMVSFATEHGIEIPTDMVFVTK